MLKSISAPEVIIVLVILLVIFGSKKISELAKGAGEITKEIKTIKKDYDEAVEDVTDDVLPDDDIPDDE